MIASALLLSCKSSATPPVLACDFVEEGAHWCSQLLDGDPSITCRERGGDDVADCPGDDAALSCDAETDDGTYRFFGYEGVEQGALDAQCEDLRRRIAAQSSGKDDDCSWSLEGDEASEFKSLSGTCSLSAATSGALAFRDTGLARAASISKLEIGFEAFQLPVMLTPENANGRGFLHQFQLSLIGRVQQAEVTRNWYCSWINGRTDPRGTFSIRLKTFHLRQDGQVDRYQGSVEAECPAAAAPAQGSVRVRVNFKGSL
jgi:hypothetical protein